MRFFFVRYIFVFFTFSGYAQAVNLDSICNEITLPIKNHTSVKKVLNLGSDFVKIPGNKYVKPVANLEKYFLSAIEYESHLKNEENVFKLKIYLLKWYGYGEKTKDEKILKLASEIQSTADKFQVEDEKWMIQVLYESYIRMELYEEVLNISNELYRINSIYGGIINSNYSIDFHIATAHYNTGNYLEAIKGYQVQADIFDKVGDQLFKASMLNDIGLCYFNLNNYSKAKLFFKTAIKELYLPSKIKHTSKGKNYIPYFRDVIKANIAKIGLSEGKYLLALNAFKNQTRWKKSVDEKHTYIQTYYNIAETYYLMNDATNALIYLDSVFVNVGIIDTTKASIKVHELKGKLFLLKGDIENANKSFKEKKRIENEIEQLKIRRKHIFVTAKFQAEEKQKEINALKNKVETNTKIRHYQFVGLILIVIILLMVLFFYLKLIKNKRQISKQKKVVESSLKEKEILLKEVHHRVKNNLQVISGLLQLQSTKLKNKDSKVVFDESQRHIHSMALVHQMLYQHDQYRIINMQEYLNQLINATIEFNSEFNFECNINAENIELEIDRVIPLGLVISELMTNSQKHAFTDEKGIVSIEIKEINNTDFSFCYSDNGKGFTPNTENKKSNTMGLKLIRMLAEEMNGNIKLDGENGFKCVIEFKQKQVK